MSRGVSPRAQRVEQLDHAGRHRRGQVDGAQPLVLRRRRRLQRIAAGVDLRRGDAGAEQQLARDGEVRAAGGAQRLTVERGKPVDLRGRRAQRPGVLDRRALQQRAVDVEEQQQRPH
jgi:hypothetical protein